MAATDIVLAPGASDGLPSEEDITRRSAIRSAATGGVWRDIAAITEYEGEPLWETPEEATEGPRLYVAQTMTRALESNCDGKYHRGAAMPGEVMIVPGGMPASFRGLEPVSTVSLALNPAFQERVLPEASDGRLPLVYCTPDARAANLAVTLRDEAADGCPNGRLFGEHLVAALSLQLWRQYGVPQKTESAHVAALSRTELRRAREFIQDNLREDIGLSEIAAAAGLSVSQLRLLFKQAMGTSVYQYVIEQRVERAKMLLQRSNAGIAEVSAAVGFYDQAHLARHVKRLLGVTPNALRGKK